MKAEDVLKSFKNRFGRLVTEGRVDSLQHRLGQTRTIHRVWFTVDRSGFKNAVRHLCRIHPDPHFSVASGYDDGKNGITVIYHFTVNYASRLAETAVSMRVRLNKRDPTLPTITDLIPGAQISERELQEMLGLRIKGTPNPDRMFLGKDFKAGVYPWRKDQTGPEHHGLVRNLHKSGGGHD